ncbi:20968_t:CDS:2 [Gigaspora margarita]|uniref:20968_t:CDS:1 n=1 Tax=Gigaspora margarita TaxID=4874 RepID=A0ABN7UTT8_GIGMA|nr:20968_t:CDS:2 [Gigaspora margarita]
MNTMNFKHFEKYRKEHYKTKDVLGYVQYYSDLLGISEKQNFSLFMLCVKLK